MTGIIHLLIGTVIALLVPDTATMFPIAFFSHYLFDFIPHIDPGTFADREQPFTKRQKMGIGVDAILIVLTTIVLIKGQHVNTHILIGAIAAQLPDLFSPLERYKWFYPFHKFHVLLHWDKSKAKHWNWYVAGIINPAIVSAICLIVIYQLV